MPITLTVLMVAVLILAAGLGGYLIAKIKYTAEMATRADAYRAQIARLKRSSSASALDQTLLTGELDRSQRRVRRYEAALRGPVEPYAEDRTVHYDMPDLVQDHPTPEPSPQLDREVLQNVEKAVDVDRFRVNFVRREIA